MTPEQLASGHVYFEVCYEDESLKGIFIQVLRIPRERGTIRN